MAKNQNKKWLKELFEQATSGADAADATALAGAMKRFYERALEEAERRFAPPRRALPCSRFICEAADMVVRRARRHVLIVAPPLEVSNQYLPVLGRIAQFSKETDVPERLAALETPEEFLALLEEKAT